MASDNANQQVPYRHRHRLMLPMVDAHIHRLIVAGAHRRPIGIVSSTDLLAAVACAARKQR